MPYQKNVTPRRQGSGKKEKEKKSKDRREIFGNLFFFLSFFHAKVCGAPNHTNLTGVA